MHLGQARYKALMPNDPSHRYEDMVATRRQEVSRGYRGVGPLMHGQGGHDDADHMQ